MPDFDLLLCPLCDSQKLRLQTPKSLVCDAGHCFDISKRGYVNLLPVQNKRSKAPGDSEEMVQARARFLDSGAYLPIADFIQQSLGALVDKTPLDSLHILDAGCGDGYYTERLQTAFSDVSCYGLDISKAAVDRASRRSKAINWLVASNRDVPLESSSFDVIICAFGFACYDEFARLLKPGGALLLFEAAANHLLELRQQLYPELVQKPLPSIDVALEQGFSLSTEDNTQVRIELNPEQLADLLVMTPHGYRAGAPDKARVLALDSLELQLDVSLRVLRLDS